MIRLRKVADADHRTLAALRADETLQHQLLAYPSAGGSHDFEAWLARRNEGHWWVIADVRNDACLGYVQLSGFHHRGRFAWLGIALAQDARGKGIGRAAMIELSAASRELGLRKLMLEVMAGNAPAVALYRSLGYREVGTLVDHYDDGARMHDTLIMETLLSS
ncbi:MULTISPECIES: GNAT family N-acetyltransferase [Rhodophyticola]|uniref:GNAT family N-acetyltransferase n=1 Tax=Rhodophyticola TaxID=2680018 RepID=UPI0035D0F2A3